MAVRMVPLRGGRFLRNIRTYIHDKLQLTCPAKLKYVWFVRLIGVGLVDVALISKISLLSEDSWYVACTRTCPG